MNLRNEQTAGYPPRDKVPFDVIAQPPPSAELYGARCCAFLAAIFHVITVRLKELTEDPDQKDRVVAAWHDAYGKEDGDKREDFFSCVEAEYREVRAASRN